MGKPRNILILSSGNPSRNPRPLKEAGLLARAGHAVTYLCPPGASSLHGEDEQLAREEGFRLLHAGGVQGFRQQLTRWLACRALALGLEHSASLGAQAALLAKARALQADLTIVHNEVPHAVGLKLLREGRRVSADFEDWHSEDLLPADRKGRPLRLLRRNEAALLARAAFCTTTSHSLAEALATRYGTARPLVVANAFPLQALPPAKNAYTAPPGRIPSFFWFSQTLGPGRGLECFLDAWALTQCPSRLVLLGKTNPDYLAQLHARVPQSFRSRIELLPLVSNQALPGLIARHDVGLALEDASIRNRDLTITNKILQYLDAGLAVVATHTRGQHEVLDRSPAAGCFIEKDSPQGTARRLDALLGDASLLQAAGKAARSLAEETYCWEKQGAVLLSAVESLLKAPHT